MRHPNLDGAFLCYHKSMRDFSDLIINNIEREGREKNNLITRDDHAKYGKKTLAALKQKDILADLIKQGWKPIWDQKKLNFVAKKEEYYASFFEKGEDANLSEVFEKMINYGISSMKWLGNKSFIKKGDGNEKIASFAAGSKSTRDFDDKLHRVDSMVTIKLSEALQKKYGHIDDKYLEMGIDGSIWQSSGDDLREDIKKHFADKISRSNNEATQFQRPMPFGFSQIDFYKNGFEADEQNKLKKGKIELAPRFVIGIEKDSVKYVRDNYYNDKERKFEEKPGFENDKFAMGIRFKIASEISAQADMMLRLFPEDCGEDKQLIAAKKDLEILRDLMTDAVALSVDNIKLALQKNAFTKEEKQLLRDLAEEQDRQKCVELVGQFYRNSKDEFNYDPVYDGIMDTVSDYVAYSQNIEAAGEDIRTPQARNYGVMYDGDKIVRVARTKD